MALVTIVALLALMEYLYFGVAVGVLFLVSRLLYFRTYIADPTKRGPGMLGSMLACVLLIAAGLLGAVHVALVT